MMMYLNQLLLRPAIKKNTVLNEMWMNLFEVV